MKKKLIIPILCLCMVLMTACGINNTISDNTGNGQDSSPTEETSESRDIKESKDNTEDMSEKQIGSDELNEVVATDVEKEAENSDVNTNNELVDGMRPEFKEAMDSYETFYDEYCEIIKKYSENPSDMELLAAYTDMLSKAAEMAEKFDAWENSDMNSAELKYYLDVNNRVAQKLLDASQ